MKKLYLDVGNSSTILYHPDQKVIMQTLQTQELCKNPRILKVDNVDIVMVSNVVETLEKKLQKIFPQLYFIRYQDIPFQSIALPSPEDIGIDRLLTSYAAWEYYQQAILVIDAGTALTACFVSQSGSYEGGMIFPGLGTCSKSLCEYTDKIPFIKVKYQNEIVGKSTKEAVEMGLFHGFYHLIDGYITQFKEKFKDLKVIATGESLAIFDNKLRIDAFHDHLIFEGIEAVQERILNKI